MPCVILYSLQQREMLRETWVVDCMVSLCSSQLAMRHLLFGSGEKDNPTFGVKSPEQVH